MTQTEQDRIEKVREMIRNHPWKYVVIGFTVNEDNNIELFSTVCVDEKQVEKNRSKLIYSVVFDLIKK